MSFYLAIDAGGTKTDYVLASDEQQLARARSGSIKRLRVDAATATVNLDQGLAELTAITGIDMSTVTRTCVGTAGESVPLVADWLREAFHARVGGELLLLGDVEIALDAAFPGQPGVLILAGTGSNVAGRSQSGKITTAGGCGPVLSDQGSGHRIGSEALRAIFLAIDEANSKETGLPPTDLLPAVMEFWGLATLDQLIEYANNTPAPDFSRLASIVLSCAQRGDQLAQSVLRREGESLAHLAYLIIRRLQRIDSDPGWVPPIAFAGSILEKITPVRDSLLSALRMNFPAVDALRGIVDPIDGALWRARNTAPGARSR
jgi:glucosamine kinase